MKRPTKYQRLPWHELQEALETFGIIGYLALAAIVGVITVLVLSFFGVLA